MSVRRFAFGLLVLLVTTAGAQAAVILDTIDMSTSATKANGIKLAAESFLADTAGTVGNVQLELAHTSNAGGIAITLNADSGGVPGTALYTIATLTSDSIPTTNTLYSFYNLGISGLHGGATYWIEVAKTQNASAPGIFTTTTAPTTGENVTGLHYYTGATTTLGSPYMAVCVSNANECSTLNLASVSISAAVPEPASVAVLGGGLIALGSLRRRRGHRATV